MAENDLRDRLVRLDAPTGTAWSWQFAGTDEEAIEMAKYECRFTCTIGVTTDSRTKGEVVAIGDTYAALQRFPMRWQVNEHRKLDLAWLVPARETAT